MDVRNASVRRPLQSLLPASASAFLSMKIHRNEARRQKCLIEQPLQALLPASASPVLSIPHRNEAGRQECLIERPPQALLPASASAFLSSRIFRHEARCQECLRPSSAPSSLACISISIPKQCRNIVHKSRRMPEMPSSVKPSCLQQQHRFSLTTPQ